MWRKTRKISGEQQQPPKKRVRISRGERAIGQSGEAALLLQISQSRCEKVARSSRAALLKRHFRARTRTIRAAEVGKFFLRFGGRKFGQNETRGDRRNRCSLLPIAI